MEQRAESAENETVILEEKEQLIMSIFDMLLDLIKIFPSTGKWLTAVPYTCIHCLNLHLITSVRTCHQQSA